MKDGDSDGDKLKGVKEKKGKKKGSPSGYNLYYKSKLPEVKEAHPEATFGETVQHLSGQW